MNVTETAKVVAMLSASYPNWSPSKETVAMYHRAFGDLSSENVMAAAEVWVMTEERYPTIAGLRKLAASLTGSLALSADEAWLEVSTVAYEYGTDRDGRPRWSTDLVRQAVRTIGYWEICVSSNPSAVRAQFLKVYGELKSRHDSQIITSVGFTGEQRLALTSSSTVGLSRSQSVGELTGGSANDL